MMKTWNCFVNVATILSFIVDGVTILWWFFQLSHLRIVPIQKLPIIDIAFPAETISFCFLLYTFLAFIPFRFFGSKRVSTVLTFISCASIPFFFFWVSIYYGLGNCWIIIFSFLGISLHFTLFVFTLLNSKTLWWLLMLIPLSASLLHEICNIGWLWSLMLGFLISYGGLLILGGLLLFASLVVFVLTINGSPILVLVQCILSFLEKIFKPIRYQQKSYPKGHTKRRQR